MSKAILTIDTPQSCSKCLCIREATHSKCQATGKFLEAMDKYIRRPKWCPMKSVKEET